MKKISTLSSQNNKELNFSLIVLILTLFCSFIIVIATFTQLNVYSVINWKIQKVSYIPQIPVIMFIAGLLGKRYGSISVLLYIITGLFFVPVFALGGGLDYILNFNFGYILAYLPGVYFASKFITQNTSIFRLIFANIAGICIIHLIGIIYLSIIFIIEKENISTILAWISNQTLNTFLLDFMFGLAGIITGNFIKSILKKIA